MLEFLVDNIFVVFGGKVFQQIVGIPMGTNCALLLADIFLYSYEADFIQFLLSTGKKKLESHFNFTYRYMYIDDVLSINNPDFENYLGQMYPAELEIKNTTVSNTSSSYLNLLLSIGKDGQLLTSLYDKLSVPEQQHSIFARLWRFYLTAHTVCQGLLFLCMFYSKGGTTFIKAHRTRKCQGTFEIVAQEVLWSILGSNQTL